MQHLVEHNNFTKPQIAAINRCRIYMRAITLTDISNGTGSFVTRDAYEGKRDPHRNSTWIWPNQEKPPRKDWKLWRDAIEIIWTQTGTRRLRQELGEWKETPHQHFNWRYSPSQDRIYWIPRPALPHENPNTNNEEDVQRLFQLEFTRIETR